VPGGTRVLSDEIVVRITAMRGSTFLDRMIALVEGAERQRSPNEIALNTLLAGLTIIFVFAVATIPAFAAYANGAFAAASNNALSRMVRAASRIRTHRTGLIIVTSAIEVHWRGAGTWRMKCLPVLSMAFDNDRHQNRRQDSSAVLRRIAASRIMILCCWVSTQPSLSQAVRMRLTV
jgi:hypothetical protein